MEPLKYSQLLFVHLFHLSFELHFQLRGIFDPTWSISCGTTILSRPTIESIASLKIYLSTTKFWPYVLYFFLFLPLLPWRVSMVKRKQPALRYQLQFALGSLSLLRHMGGSRRQPPLAQLNPGPVAGHNHLPPHSRCFCLTCLSHSPRRQGPPSNSPHHACRLGYTSPPMRHCGA